MRRVTDRGWARFFARGIVGILFFMAGWWKCFELTPVGHTQRFFLEAYADTWIPVVLLWAIGLSIPVVELVAGGLVVVGFRTREALIALGFILLDRDLRPHSRRAALQHPGPHLSRGACFFWRLSPFRTEEDRLSVDSWLRRRKRATG